MEPRIHYAKTSDGVSIAYWTLGNGTPLIHMPVLYSHVQLEWEIPECRRWYERLAERRQLVRYDPRGMGLSQRRAGDYSIEGWGREIEAIADRLGFERFALLGLQHTGPMAIKYAADHSDRVSHLILWHSYTSAAEWLQSPRLQAMRAALVQDWDTYTEMAAHMFLGWSAGEQARRYAALIRQSVEREDLLNILPALNQFDVSASLPAIPSPTLVLHRRDFAFLDVGVARELAARIPDARLVLLEGESGAPYLGDTDAVATAIDEFLGDTPGAAPGSAPARAAVLVTILFTDVEGSTALTQRLGDAAARELLREHERAVREALAAHAGSEVKTMGDGFMASFASAAGALDCAIAIQRALSEADTARPEPVEGRAGIKVRIGLNAGEPIAEEDADGRGDLFGTAVISAARIAAQAQGGEVLVSNVVRELVAGKGFLFADRGDAVLRGFDDPVRLYELRWQA